MKLKNLMILALCVVMLFTTTLNAYAAAFIPVGNIDTTNGEEVADFYDKLLDYLVKNYKYEITKEELMSAAIENMLKEHPERLVEMGKNVFEALDKNSSYYTMDEFTAVYEDVSGVYVGIGVHVIQEGTKIMLGEAIEGSPAESSGLRVGDVVVAVDGQDVTEYALEKVTSLIKGEEGTDVSITVLRNDSRYTYTLTRREIVINPITYHKIEGTNVGYVKITDFNAGTNDAFDEAMTYFAGEGISNLVLDLRNNLGGYLGAAIHVASYFVPDGKLVVTKEHKNPEKNDDFYANKTDHKFKAAVLINEYSASASEVVASALRDYGTGVLVGKRSFGKGTVQDVIKIRSGDVLWLTIAEYYTPSHTPIHGIGLDPDHHVANSTAKYDIKNVNAYDILRVLSVGDKGEDVYAVKQRLKELGYFITVDDVYDERTAEVVAMFQGNEGLFPYGKADLTTQIKLNDVLINTDVEVDNQLEKAINLAKTL